MPRFHMTRILGAYPTGHASPTRQAPAGLNLRRASVDKIALFRILFGGHEDAYAHRFENQKTGRPGYALAYFN
jgi:hypothetical protein